MSQCGGLPTLCFILCLCTLLDCVFLVFLCMQVKGRGIGGSSRLDGLLLRPGSLPLGPNCQSRQREAGRPRYVARHPQGPLHCVELVEIIKMES